MMIVDSLCGCRKSKKIVKCCDYFEGVFIVVVYDVFDLFGIGCVFVYDVVDFFV